MSNVYQEERFIKYFRTIGITLFSVGTTRQTIHRLLLGVCFVSTLALMLNFCQHNKADITKLVPVISVMVVVMISSIKALALFIMEKKVYDLISEVKILNDIDSVTRKKSTAMNMWLIKLFDIYYFLSLGTAVLYVIMPTCDYCWQYFIVRNINATRYVPLYMKFPVVDDSKSPFNEICTLLAGLIAYLTVVVLLNVDNIIFVVAMNIKTHFIILQDKFRSEKFEKSELNATKLIAYIKYHLKLLDLSNLLNEICKVIVFPQTVLTTLQICAIIYQITDLSEGFLDALPNISFLMALSIELLIYCYGGELITCESLNLGLAIQECAWYNLNVNDQTTILIMLARTQKPMRLSSGTFILSLESYMAIWKKAWSYVTVMRSVQ